MVEKGLAFDALQDESEGEGGFQFDDDGWLVGAAGEQVEMADLGFDLVALGFEEGFDGG